MMTKLPLSDTVCRRRLTKWIEANYTEAEQEVLAYYDDIEEEHKYTFKYDNPINGEKVHLSINRMTGKITKRY